MNSFWLYPFIVFSGIMQGLGNSMNAQLRNSLQNPWLASLVSFLLILAFFVCAFAAMPRPLPTTASLNSMPWWAPFGVSGGLLMILGISMIAKN